MNLIIDGQEVVICRFAECSGAPHLVRVFIKPKTAAANLGPFSQHDIPRDGVFRVNGHSYEWR